MDNRLLVARQSAAAGGLLDLVPGAAAAYSLRKLSSTYTDPVVTVRRSSDNAEDSFTASEVSDGTLAAFCGVGDGFVKQWWNQSGNANHASASGTSQPKIVSSGAVILEEGKPAIQFDGSDDFFSFAPVSSLDPWTIAEVKRRPTAGTNGPTVGTASPSQPIYPHWQYSDNLVYARNRQGEYSYGPVSNEQIISVVANPTSLKSDMSVFRNGVAPPRVSIAAAASDADFVYIGRVANLHCAGLYQEIIFYPSDQTANRELIEGNIAWSYS